MMLEAVEIEVAAYYTKSHAEARGLSTPAGRSYESSSLTPQERQARVLSAKQRSRCRACGQIGHWQRDPICPKARGKGVGGSKAKGKGKGGFRKGKDGKSGGGKKGKSHSESPPKSRVVYFSVGAETLPHSTSFMALGNGADGPGEEQPIHLDAEQQRQFEEQALLMMAQHVDDYTTFCLRRRSIRCSSRSFTSCRQAARPILCQRLRHHLLRLGACWVRQSQILMILVHLQKALAMRVANMPG